jgi:MoaA/NifB/PqqE/SkfB family radical SAM enzyme
MLLDKRNMYRMPWSLNDNPIAWLEVTDICNLHCEGCYRQHMTGHKTLEQVKEEVLFFKRWRNPDNVSIAGGEPLIYPHIVDLVAFIAQNDIKPIILTNGIALDANLLRELKRAGLAGFTLHVDSHQDRPHWKGKTEAELNALRQEFADLIAAEKGLYVIFNSTIYPSTLNEIPDIVRWGQAHMDRVHGLVFITYRTAATDSHVARSADDRVVDLGQLSYVRETFDETFVTTADVCRVINETCPAYQPAAYLGGSIRHDSFKWTISALIGSQSAAFGSVGKKTMELAQIGHHLFTGSYLAYLSQARFGRSVFFLSPWDSSVRQAAGAWWKAVWRRPTTLFEPVRLQSIAIIQAPDLLPDGRADMCDSCPDITIHDGQLVNSCRMDEYRLFGGFLSVTERPEETSPSEKQS